MGESPDERITNLKYIINQYSNTDVSSISVNHAVTIVERLLNFMRAKIATYNLI